MYVHVYTYCSIIFFVHLCSHSVFMRTCPTMHSAMGVTFSCLLVYNMKFYTILHNNKPYVVFALYIVFIGC